MRRRIVFIAVGLIALVLLILFSVVPLRRGYTPESVHVAAKFLAFIR
jgi:hypothetical protein